MGAVGLAGVPRRVLERFGKLSLSFLQSKTNSTFSWLFGRSTLISGRGMKGCWDGLKIGETQKRHYGGKQGRSSVHTRFKIFHENIYKLGCHHGSSKRIAVLQVFHCWSASEKTFFIEGSIRLHVYFHLYSNREYSSWVRDGCLPPKSEEIYLERVNWAIWLPWWKSRDSAPAL